MSLSRDLLKWVLSLDLAFAVKNVKRDFSNGFLFAEILTRFYPSDISMSSFENVTSSAKKKANWILLEKVMKKKGLLITSREIDAIIAAEDDAALKLLERLYKDLGSLDREARRPSEPRASSTGGVGPSPSPPPVPAAPAGKAGLNVSFARSAAGSPSAVNSPKSLHPTSNSHANSPLSQGHAAAVQQQSRRSHHSAPSASGSQEEYYRAMSQAAAQYGYDPATFQYMMQQQQAAQYYQYYGLDPAQAASYYNDPAQFAAYQQYYASQQQGQPHPKGSPGRHSTGVDAFYYDASGQAYAYSYGPEGSGAAHSPRKAQGQASGGRSLSAHSAPRRDPLPPSSSPPGGPSGVQRPSAAAVAVAAKAKKGAERELKAEAAKREVQERERQRDREISNRKQERERQREREGEGERERRQVEYQPYSLRDYREKFAGREYVQLGKLGPDIDPEVAQKREKIEKMKAYVPPKPLPAAAPKPPAPKEPTAREKAILYAKNVPKPLAMGREGSDPNLSSLGPGSGGNGRGSGSGIGGGGGGDVNGSSISPARRGVGAGSEEEGERVLAELLARHEADVERVARVREEVGRWQVPLGGEASEVKI